MELPDIYGNSIGRPYHYQQKNYDHVHSQLLHKKQSYERLARDGRVEGSSSQLASLDRNRVNRDHLAPLVQNRPRFGYPIHVKRQVLHVQSQP